MQRLLAGVGTVALAAVVLWGVFAPSPTAADRVQELGDRIRCPVCNGESIADSPAETARQMLAIVEEQVEAGATDGEVIDFFVARYGEAILLDPPFSGATLALWLIPVAGVVAGAWILVVGFRTPQGHAEPASPAPDPTRGRVLKTALGVGVATVAVGALAAFAIQPRQSGPISGATVGEEFDLDSVSNEQMEAVIAANLDNPQIAGMRMALADRYFAARDFRSALPHYFAVLESEASRQQASVALARLGWMTWESAGAAELATAQAYLDRALSEDPANLEASLFKGLVTLYGAENCGGAIPYLEAVGADPSVEGAARRLVDDALADAGSGLGGRCT